jgi:hypothetical protein
MAPTLAAGTPGFLPVQGSILEQNTAAEKDHPEVGDF